jgi:hypothetical protein
MRVAFVAEVAHWLDAPIAQRATTILLPTAMMEAALMLHVLVRVTTTMTLPEALPICLFYSVNLAA